MTQALNAENCAFVKSGIHAKAELSVETFASSLNLPVESLTEYGVRTVDVGMQLPYRRKDGRHVRYRYLHDVLGQGTWDDDDEAGRCLYGLDTLPAWGETVFLVVGEAACHVIWHHGYDAVGLAELQDFDPRRDDEDLDPYDIIVILDRGVGGEAMVEALSRSRIRHRIRVTPLIGYDNIVRAQIANANVPALLQQASNESQRLDEYLAQYPLLDRVKTPERVELQLRAGDRTRVIDETMDVIRQHGALYERGGELVRLCGTIVVPVQEHWLADYCGRLISWKRWTPDGSGGFKLAATDTPSWVCKIFLQKRGERGLKELAGIITAPTIRDDGTLLERPGFDEATGLLLRPGQWPRIPERPSVDDLRAAWNVLWEPVAEFPFVSNVDRAVTIAAMLTATVRRTLPKAPAFSFDAPVAGSGKTLLATCIAELAGGDVAVVPECREEEELRKRLLSVLRDSQPSILLDNVKGQFKSSALEAFLTDDYYSDRVLAASQMLRLPTNILTLISGNNFIPQGDLWRRMITARIDPRVEHAERRSFKVEPRQHCRRHRQQLVAAALTLMRGHIAAGLPRFTPDRLASFEAWDDRVRQCVLWLNHIGVAELADPTTPIAVAKELEPERLKLGAFLEATKAVMGHGESAERWRTNDLIQKANMGLEVELHRELRDVLMEIAGDGRNICPRRLGKWIEKQTDSRCGGLYVERVGERKRAVLWRINGHSEEAGEHCEH